MANQVRYLNPKGSIIYKLLIVVLVVVLIFSIVYPTRLWEKEQADQTECRHNMTHILYAELVYLMEKDAYTDTVENAVNLIKQDTTGILLRQFANIDSVLSDQIIAYLKKQDTRAAAIIDTLHRFGYQRDLDTTAALILDSLRTYDKYKHVIDSMAIYALDHLYECPTVMEPYKVAWYDTAAYKEIFIRCPLDSLDSLNVANDFMLNTIGGLRISNHGHIDNGELSWE